MDVSVAEAVVIVGERVGRGVAVEAGQVVMIRYRTRVDGGEVVDASGGRPLRFRRGVGAVIEGLERGLEGVRVGGRRTLRIPAALAYGRAGLGDRVPPLAALLVEVEVLSAE